MLCPFYLKLEPLDSPKAKIVLKNMGRELPFSILMVTAGDGNHFTNNGDSINTNDMQYLVGEAEGGGKVFPPSTKKPYTTGI